MAKTYTAQEMREMAFFFDRNADQFSKARLNSVLARIPETITMLGQAADALEREKQIIEEVGKIDSMKVALLDGHPMHQQTNAKRVTAILEFFTKVKEIIGGVKSLEREEKCEKKYEYGVMSDSRCEGVYDSLRDARLIMDVLYIYETECNLVRREVGEWEEVSDGEHE